MPRRVYTRAHAAARIFGESVDPLAVTQALRIPPDLVYRVGEPRLSRTRTGAIKEGPSWAKGMWSFSSKDWVQSPKLAQHLAWLLDQLEPKAEQIAALVRGGAQADLFCFSCGATPKPPQLPLSLRERAAALGMPIGIDHYVDSPNGE